MILSAGKAEKADVFRRTIFAFWLFFGEQAQKKIKTLGIVAR